MIVTLWLTGCAMGGSESRAPCPPVVEYTSADQARAADEVDSLIRDAEAAGATVTRRPAETFYGGYAGCFADPDGHVWEVAHNPGFPRAADGSLTLPDLG